MCTDGKVSKEVDAHWKFLHQLNDLEVEKEEVEAIENGEEIGKVSRL